MRRVWLSTVLAIAAHSRAVHADPSPASESSELDTMRRELARQRAELERVEAEIRERPEQTLRFSGYVQLDWVVHDQASHDEIDFSNRAPLNRDRFLLRRGHVRLDADRGPLSAVVEVDANTNAGAQLRPVDVEAGLHWPWGSGSEEPEDGRPALAFDVGLMKIPFGVEVPESDAVRPFLERSTAMRALFPGEFDLGARLVGRYRGLELSVALMNGHPIGDAVFPALAPASAKEIVGRLSSRAEIAAKVGLEIGVSADGGRGFHEGTPTTKDQLVWRDDNGDGIVQATEIDVVAGSSATPSRTFDRFAIGADARLSATLVPLGELTIRGEIVRSKNLDRGLEVADPIGAGYDLREFGWSAGVTQEITRWGMIGVRYDRYDPDADAHEQRAIRVVPADRSHATLALMAMLRYQNGRLVVEYDRNHDALGRTASGVPTSLASDAVILRGQEAF